MSKWSFWYQIINWFISALCIIKLYIWPWGKQALNDGWHQQCIKVPFSLTPLCCSIIKKTKSENLHLNKCTQHWTSALFALQAFWHHWQIELLVAAEGFWSREERREEGLSLSACFTCPSTEAEDHLHPTLERNRPSPLQAPGKPRLLLRATKFHFVFLASSLRMWLWKFQARLKSWWCARDKIWEKSPQKKSFPDTYFDIRVLSVLSDRYLLLVFQNSFFSTGETSHLFLASASLSWEDDSIE